MTNPKIPKTESFLSQAIAKSRTSSELSTSSDDTEKGTVQLPQDSPDITHRLQAERYGWKEIHGFRGNQYWDAPLQIKKQGSQSSRSISATSATFISKNVEYEDEPYVFRQKIKLLAEMILASRRCCIYSGKDIDSNINTDKDRTKPSTTSPSLLGYFAIAALYRSGRVHYWVQQDCNGLSQQCGYPQEKLNEIHGSLYDPSNPVVSHTGTLRADLFEDMITWENVIDLTLSMGTSRCGMNSDRIFKNVAKKGLQGIAIGGVIIGVHKMKDDNLAALKIYANIENALEVLLQELNIDLRLPRVTSIDDAYILQIPKESYTSIEDVYRLPYDHHGNRLTRDPSKLQINSYCCLDLREGSIVRVVAGVNQGQVGEILGRTNQGHYRIRFSHIRREGELSADLSKSEDGCNVTYSVLGLWWLESAARGAIPFLPIISISTESSLENLKPL